MRIANRLEDRANRASVRATSARRAENKAERLEERADVSAKKAMRRAVRRIEADVCDEGEAPSATATDDIAPGAPDVSVISFQDSLCDIIELTEVGSEYDVWNNEIIEIVFANR